MKEVVKLSGFKDLDRALGELPKATARNVLKRTLVKAGEPIADRARQLVPVLTSELKDSITVSARLKNKAGASEFAAAMRAGLGKAAAVRALRDARRAGGGSFAEMYVGPGALPHAHMVEFGTSKMAAQPYMRPAWESTKRQALDVIERELGNEIIKAAKRISSSKRQSADVKYRASVAALLAHEAAG